jgi:3-oxoacyl-[acyl-carrier protein] reductase
MKEYYSKRALVTGGSRGIGRAIVNTLCEQGYEVFYFSRTSGDTDTDHIHHLYVDMGDSSSIEQGLSSLFEMTEYLDVVVNNAGITRDALLMRLSDEAWDSVMSVNLRSVFQVCRGVTRSMTKRRHGSIINISSVVGVVGNGGQTNYSASKAGLIGFSKSMAKELSSRNIRVNVIAPGFIDTSMSDAIPEAMKETLINQIPMKRIGEVDEVAKVVAFFASDDASYITGQVLCVDGGMVM